MYPVKLENKAFAITIDETKKNLLELRKAEQNYFKPEDYSKILQAKEWHQVTNPVTDTDEYEALDFDAIFEHPPEVEPSVPKPQEGKLIKNNSPSSLKKTSNEVATIVEEEPDLLGYESHIDHSVESTAVARPVTSGGKDVIARGDLLGFVVGNDMAMERAADGDDSDLEQSSDVQIEENRPVTLPCTRAVNSTTPANLLTEQENIDELVRFMRSSFENTMSTLSSLQDKGRVAQESGRQVLEEWIRMAKKGQEEYKKLFSAQLKKIKLIYRGILNPNAASKMKREKHINSKKYTESEVAVEPLPWTPRYVAEQIKANGEDKPFCMTLRKLLFSAGIFAGSSKSYLERHSRPGFPPRKEWVTQIYDQIMHEFEDLKNLEEKPSELEQIAQRVVSNCEEVRKYIEEDNPVQNQIDYTSNLAEWSKYVRREFIDKKSFKAFYQRFIEESKNLS